MRTLRFHRSLYAPAAVSEAIAVFAEHGQVQIDDSSGDHVIVHLAAVDRGDEEALAGAFANYVLGASVHAQQRQPE
jgi:hypothetical protein